MNMLVDIKEQINEALNLEKSGKFLEAECIYNDIINANNNALALNLLGLLKYRQGQVDIALGFINKSIEISPCVSFYMNLGRIYINENDFYEAIRCYKSAIQLEMDNFDAWFHLAYSLKKNKQFDEAIIAYQKALQLNPGSEDVYHNLGNIYCTVKNDLESAIYCYKKYLEYHPEDTDAKSCLGALYLKQKNYKDGWVNLEYCVNKARAIVDNIPEYYNNKTKSKPLWHGENIEDKVLYVYYDGGLGDTIMFLRYLPSLKYKCAKIIFSPQDSIIQLLQDSGFDWDGLEIKNSECEINFDVHIPIMSIPYVLNLNSEKDIPLSQGYLKADPLKIEAYRQKYFDNNCFKIGIKWQGDMTYDQTRQFDLKSFSKILKLPNVKIYSVQKDSGSEQLEEFKNYEIVDLGSTFNDFTDTAAAIENLDLVICNDTSVAHLTGAMGKKCWIVLPFVQDWRWSVDLSYCPWYKSIKLFKQHSLGSWEEVFEDVFKELQTTLP